MKMNMSIFMLTLHKNEQEREHEHEHEHEHDIGMEVFERKTSDIGFRNYSGIGIRDL